MSEIEMSRETDAAVFRAMGYTAVCVEGYDEPCWVIVDREGYDHVFPRGSTEAEAWAGVPEVSRLWDACEGVVDWVIAGGAEVTLNHGGWGKNWYCAIVWSEPGHDDGVDVTADTMPLALCRAVLAYAAAMAHGPDEAKGAGE